MAKKAASREPTATLSREAPHYTVLARRCRPQQFGDLVGQEPIAQALVNALKANRVAHAYLFTGARGVGKTSTARILAKALNCVNGPTPTPCDQCESCRAIAVGEDVDVLEIDGASNNKVEEVRELRQNVQYRPSRSRHKIYIIDEVHMLTTSAFNALLKTLEEPPPHVKFIFATTEVQKIPVTILSRCQRFDFGGISTKRIQERLQQIVAAEGQEAEPEAVEIIARRAGGSMRDAQSLLDQLLAFGHDRLTASQVHQLLGTADQDLVAALATAVLGNDAASALALLQDATERGVQSGELVDQLVQYWRELLLTKSAGSDFEGLTFPQRVRETLQQQAQARSLDTLLAGLDILATTKVRLRGTNYGQVLLEMAVVRLSRLDNLLPLAQFAQLLENGNLSPTQTGQASRGEVSVKKNSAPTSTKRPHEDHPAVEPGPGSPIPLSPESLGEIWPKALSQVGHMLRAELEKATIAISAPNCLVLCFSPRYNSSKEFCQEPARCAKLEAALHGLTGQTVAVRFEAGSPAAAVSKDIDSPKPKMQQLRREAAQEPLVKRALEGLGAQLLHADSGFGQAGTVTSPAGGESEDDADHV
jgi:DNA polymerase-3 subunit gamma/tau